MDKKQVLLALLFQITIFGSTNTNGLDKFVSKEFHRLLTGYNRRIRPNYSGNATVVNIDATILKFGELNEMQMTYSMDLSLRQTWIDQRLRHNSSNIIISLIGKGVPSDVIWTPDTYIVNTHIIAKQDIASPNAKFIIRQDGTIFLETSMNAVVNCKMDFHKYPMDVHSCGMILQSYAYPKEHIVYRWHGKGYTVRRNKIAQFTMSNIRINTGEKYYDLEGVFSTLEVTFRFERKISAYVLQIFFPCAAIVCASWFSFWFHKHCVSARFGIGAMTLWILCFMWGTINLRLPRVDYLTSVDTYFIASFCFIVCSIMEFVIVLNISANKNEEKEENKNTLQNQWRRKRRRLVETRRSFKNIGDSRSRSSTETTFGNENIAMNELNKIGNKRRRLSVPTHATKEGIFVNDFTSRVRSSTYSFMKVEPNRVISVKPKRNENKNPECDREYYNSTPKLDLASRIAFPFAYFAFNVLFWLTMQSYKNMHN
ncbi:gamma-aminobutyric acid receptor subunit alpha-6-like [Hydractinia symbiolongicarpus]|uniref:gamma-aminobutyric acid receptor subunit alpha-6-like n=1 Tax=Hydractinia symbiolongicarpus TaxID=13093 RepID=UPI002549F003|nr:gamma-aminobutyric acid receptor subunit alpha-6-like [Hydractinia symbiolongicarpus]